jgi:hypothetical protein
MGRSILAWGASPNDPRHAYAASVAGIPDRSPLAPAVFAVGASLRDRGPLRPWQQVEASSPAGRKSDRKHRSDTHCQNDVVADPCGEQRDRQGAQGETNSTPAASQAAKKLR